MFQRFRAMAMAAPGLPAIIEAFSGRTVTRRELFARAEELAANIREGELVALQLPNSLDFVATILAVMKRKAIAMPIDRDASAAEVEGIMTHFGARPELPPDARIIKLTSGSTGKPKGIVTSEQNLIADCENICASMDIGPDDINFGAIPLSHSYGFSNLVMPLITQGTALVISNSYLPQTIIDFSNRYQCTILPGIPMMFEHLASTERADGSFATVRTFISAGAPLPPSTSRRFRERFGKSIHSFYGCSECGGIAYDREGGSIERGAVGRAMEGVTLSTRSGRLIVHSASAAIGYLNDATRFDAFERGKFVTDDLVELRDGEVRLTGRVSDLINIAGKKVNPREIEQVILQIEGVRQVKVYGEPAGARGDVVAAAIVANPEITREDVRAFCRERLSIHKVPRIVKLIESMPVDDRGKVSRAALAEL
ncbi:MAG TPA: class I adenylate-forming enzyme family protein [Thermoanaerobaculia bacterium]